MNPLAIATIAMLAALALMLVSPVNASPTPDMRPKPRPPLDCWVDENGNLDGCRVKENDQ